MIVTCNMSSVRKVISGARHTCGYVARLGEVSCHYRLFPVLYQNHKAYSSSILQRHFTVHQKFGHMQTCMYSTVGVRYLHHLPVLDKGLMASYISVVPAREFSFYNWVVENIYFSNPVLLTEYSLQYMHDCSGLPWWATILFVTCTFRCLITFPLGVYSHKIFAKLELLIPERQRAMKVLESYIKSAILSGEINENQAKKVFIRQSHEIGKELIVKHGCSPYKTLITTFVQIPFWISLSLAIRKLTGCIRDVPPHSQMVTEGVAWFTNFTLCDPYFILPILLLVSHLGLIEILFQNPNVQLPKWMKKNFFRVLTVCVALLSTIMPSGVSFFWVVSACFGLAQNVLLRLPKIRRICGIPETSSELKQPLKFVWQNLTMSIKSK